MNLVFGSTPKECKQCFSERNSENNSDFRLSYAIKKKMLYMDIWQQFLSLNEQETANQKKKKEPFWSKMEEVKRDKSEIFWKAVLSQFGSVMQHAG